MSYHMKHNKTDYAQKLQDPRWQRKRLEVMQAADWKCVICGDEKEELNVHHPVYSANCEPWDYLNLQCLCKTCHTINHATKWKLLIHAKQAFEERESLCNQREDSNDKFRKLQERDPFGCEFDFWREKGSWDNDRESLHLMRELQFETILKHKELREIFHARLREITSQIKFINCK